MLFIILMAIGSLISYKVGRYCGTYMSTGGRRLMGYWLCFFFPFVWMCALIWIDSYVISLFGW